MVTIPENLKEEFLKLVDKGDEAKAREFVIAHIKEFPQESQDSIIVALLEEALEKKKENDSLVSAFRKEGLEAAAELGKGSDELERQLKMAEIREKI